MPHRVLILMLTLFTHVSFAETNEVKSTHLLSETVSPFDDENAAASTSTYGQEVYTEAQKKKMLEDCLMTQEYKRNPGNFAASASNELTLESPQDEQIMKVVGEDDRIRIYEPVYFPYSAHGFIVSRYKNNKMGTCTGTMVGPRHVLTAGHCVYNKQHGGWAKHVQFTAGSFNQSSDPYNSPEVKRFMSVSGWVNNGDPKHDYAILILDKVSTWGNPQELGATTCWYDIKRLNSSSLKNAYVHVTGYPYDKTYGSMWTGAGQIFDVEDKQIHINNDVMQGNSGGGIWMWPRYNEAYSITRTINGKTVTRRIKVPYVVGIASGEYTFYLSSFFGYENVGVRINDENYNRIVNDWLKNY